MKFEIRRLLTGLCAGLLLAPSALAIPPLASGYNGQGQLGDGTLVLRFSPVRVGGAVTFNAVAGGAAHTVARAVDGSLWAWGDNSSGQLGDSTATLRKSPVQISATGVLAGRSVTALAADGRSSYALLDNGTLAAWGHNLDGELGDGTTINRLLPVLVPGLSGVVNAEAGSYHALAALGDGTVRAWGFNGQGQLGDGTTTQRNSPVGVNAITTATAVAGGNFHSLARLLDGTVLAWGNNASGQLGDGTLTQRKSPVAVASLTGITQIAAGAEHSVALKNDGTVWTWGGNSHGELGLGDTANRTSPLPVPGIASAVQIAATGSHTLVRLADGSVRVFGDNSLGQLGDGTTTDRTSPVQLLEVGGATGIASGSFHSIILAPRKPIVVIAAVTDLTSTGATINGTVNPSEETTSARFEYGPTAAVEMSVPIVLSPDNGTIAQFVSATISGLTPGSNYFFRIVATNAAGTLISNTQILTTRTRYAQWALDKLGDAAASGTDDPDKDKLANIVEYVTGTEPLQFTAPPAASVVDNRLALTFTRNTDAKDAVLIVQAGDDLVTWTDIASSADGAATIALVTGVVVEETGTGPVLTVVVRDSLDVDDPAHPRRFLRLRASR